MGPLTLSWEVRPRSVGFIFLVYLRDIFIILDVLKTIPLHDLLRPSIRENWYLYGVSRREVCVVVGYLFIFDSDGRTKDCANWTVVLPWVAGHWWMDFPWLDVRNSVVNHPEREISTQATSKGRLFPAVSTHILSALIAWVPQRQLQDPL